MCISNPYSLASQEAFFFSLPLSYFLSVLLTQVDLQCPALLLQISEKEGGGRRGREQQCSSCPSNNMRPGMSSHPPSNPPFIIIVIIVTECYGVLRRTTIIATYYHIIYHIIILLLLTPLLSLLSLLSLPFLLPPPSPVDCTTAILFFDELNTTHPSGLLTLDFSVAENKERERRGGNSIRSHKGLVSSAPSLASYTSKKKQKK
jgi:hypothetical protein